MSDDIEPVNVEAKRKMKKVQQQRVDAQKAKMRRQRKCFWTKPYGHVYEWQSTSRFPQSLCVGCGKREP